MGRMSQESCTSQYVSSCVKYSHCTGCPGNVVTWFLTMSELMVWVEKFYTLWSETMIIMSETFVASEIRFFWGCGTFYTA